MHMCKILIFQLRIFVACVIALPSRAKDDSMGRMPLRAPKVLQLSRNPRTWKSLGVLLLRLHVFTFLKHVLMFPCLQVFCFAMFLLKNTSQMRVCSSRWWSRFSFWCLAPFSAQHGGIVSWIFHSMDDSPQTASNRALHMHPTVLVKRIVSVPGFCIPVSGFTAWLSTRS